MKLHEVAPDHQQYHEIKTWLDSMYITHYTIRPGGVVDVVGTDIHIRKFDGTTLPIQFGLCSGSFDCSYSQLTSLKGAPPSVGGDFICANTNLTSLRGSLQFVGGNFNCYSTNITSLEGAPQSVGGSFECYASKNLRSFHDIHKQIKHIGGHFFGGHTSTHLLGLLLIDGITEIDIDGGPVDKILNKYVGTGDIISAQDEMIDAGLIDQARL